MNLMLAAQENLDQIIDTLLALVAKSPAPQMKLCEPEVAIPALKQAITEGRLYIFGDYLILVDVGSPWHTSKRILIEELVIRFRKVYGNSVESAVAQLEVIAKQRGCVAIAAGDTQIGLMSDRYIAAGFQALGSQFYKEIP